MEEDTVARSRFSITLLGLTLTLAALAALPAAPAQAVAGSASKVLFSQQESGEPAKRGEVSTFAGMVSTSAGECFGTDSHGVMGKNPSGTGKVAGSNAPETEVFCSAPEDSLTIKGVTINKAGVMTLNLNAVFHTNNGCAYRLTKLTGNLESGTQTSAAPLTGTAHLIGSESTSKTCAKTEAGSGFQGVANSSFENYTVTF
jgi:hypothetical protein